MTVAWEDRPCAGRHWFSQYGNVGLRRPVCTRCPTPNPKWSAEDQASWEFYVTRRLRVPLESMPSHPSIQAASEGSE